MKTKYILLVTLFTVFSTFSQEFTVTPDGLRDASNNDKSYVVIKTADKTPEQNYNNALDVLWVCHFVTHTHTHVICVSVWVLRSAHTFSRTEDVCVWVCLSLS